MPSSDEKTINKCLLTVALRGLSGVGDLKLQKLIFLCENELVSRQLGALNYKFYMYRYGPYSSQLTEDHKELGQFGLLRGGSLSRRGRALADAFREMLQDSPTNRKVLTAIEETAYRYGALGGTALKQRVYDKTVFCYQMGQLVRVGDIPRYYDIFVPHRMKDTFKEFLSLGEDELESLELSLSTSESDLADMRKRATGEFNKTFLNV